MCWHQVWIGTKQKELEAGSMQLMHQYTPWATGLLAILVPVFEPVGFTNPGPETILGFDYTFASSAAIIGSAVSAPAPAFLRLSLLAIIAQALCWPLHVCKAFANGYKVWIYWMVFVGYF